ncbi:MAG TPA: hypothetical protein VIK57_09100 [Streptosporangiaceae bacterium]
MTLEDLAAFRAIHGSTVLYPCDANQTARLTAAMADRQGVSYLRLTRGRHPGHLRGGRGIPGGRQPGAALVHRRPGDHRRGGHHRA